MGATLPAIARWVDASPRGVSWLGFFYGGNTAGAVIGSLVAGFYLLRRFDTAVATYAAVGLNLTVAILALLVASGRPYRPLALAPTSVARDRWSVYVAIALSGTTALAAQVIWTRLLSLMLGATVYTFSLILAVFLAGLGIGSSVGSVVARDVSRPRVALAGLERVRADAVAPVLADQSLDRHRSLAPVSARPDAVRLCRAARRRPVGCQLSARARFGRVS
jgi:spermidine synthase